MIVTRPTPDRFGETLALLGGVIFFLTSMPTWYIAGVIVLTTTFVAFPAPLRR